MQFVAEKEGLKALCLSQVNVDQMKPSTDLVDILDGLLPFSPPPPPPSK